METVTLRHVGGRDPRTGDWPDTVSTSELDVLGLEPLPSADVEGTSRQGSTGGYKVYAPAGSTVDPTDEVIIRGETYRLVGRVEVWQNPIAPGVLDGVVFTVREGVG